MHIIINYCLCFFVDIIVNFEFFQYSVMEGENVSVCVLIVSGTSQITFILGLNASLMTAVG